MKNFNKKFILASSSCILALSMGINAQAQTRTLKVWDFLTGAGNVYDKWEHAVAKDFKETTGANLVWVHKDAQTYKVAIKVAMKSNNAPDVFQYSDGRHAIDFINAGYAYDMSDLAKKLKPKKYSSDAFFDLYAFYKGKNYGYALGQAQKYLYYNKKLFKQYNLTPPKTFKDLINICKISKKKNSRMIPFGLGNLSRSRAIHIVSQLNGYYVPLNELQKDYLGTSSASKIFTNPGYLKSLERLNEMKNSKCFERSPNTTSNDVIASLFENNRTLTEYAGTWNDDRYHKALGDNLGIITRLPLPSDALVKNAQDYNFSTVSGFMIHKQTKVLDLSKAFMTSVIKNHNVYNLKYTKRLVNDFNTLKHKIFVTDVYMDHRLSEIYLTDVQSMLGGSMTPKQVMTSLRKKALSLINND